LESPILDTEMIQAGVQGGKDLWVDKYTSKKYFDLLTDDITNRKVMTWLRSWQELLNPDDPKLNLAPPELGKKPEPFFFKKFDQKQPFESENSFQNKRVLMLYGPPGTGKSTMARVLATQCGYLPKSVNASDVRTGTELCLLIRNSLEMNEINVLGESKPTCLILDEVDGALGGSEGDQSKGLKLVAEFL
jgi:chromosome transmission fidelity protein 18